MHFCISKRPCCVRNSCAENWDRPQGSYLLCDSSAQIHCGDSIGGEQYLLIHPSANNLNSELLSPLTRNTKVLVVFKSVSGDQRYGVLEQLSQYEDTPLQIRSALYTCIL